MDISTTYLGLKLRSPLVPSASPLSVEIEDIQRMEQHGAAAVVLYSLFEEQLRKDSAEMAHYQESYNDIFYEAQSFIPKAYDFQLGPEGYLRHLGKTKQAVSIPVIASLNGCSSGGWPQFARRMQDAGADAIELNLYSMQTDPERDSNSIEAEYRDIVQAVCGEVSIPVAVKISPYFTNISRFSRDLIWAGAKGLVLFNRFYQPDIDIEKLEVRSDVFLSSPQTLRLPLRWIGILYGRLDADFAATGGVHGAVDVIKMLMVGANITMLCAILMRKGIRHLSVLEEDLKRWMKENEYESVAQMRGSMSQKSCADPSAYERAQYLKVITAFRSSTH